jgi:oligopeptide/dipeptide ABC transporter ATP-binding protein
MRLGRHAGACRADLVTLPSGCRFHPRCPRAIPVFAQAAPVTQTMSAEHTVACHLY